MDFLNMLGGAGGNFFAYLLPFLFVLTIVVFFHELGHFSVARFFNVKVDTFSIGFGGELFGFNDRHGTRWKLSWIPLGGYVKFAGDDNAASMPDRERLETVPEAEREGLFFFKPLYQRAAVVAAGPFANFILSIFIFGLLAFIFGQPTTPPIVHEVQADSPAAVAGFEPGDEILAIDGGSVDSFEDVRRVVSVSGGDPLRFTVERDGGLLELDATPEVRVVTDRFGNEHKIGTLGVIHSLQGEGVVYEPVSPFGAVAHGAEMTWFIVVQTFDYLGRIVTGRESAEQLGGPLRIAQVSGQVATLGFDQLVNLAAVLSVSIGLLNLFPVPMLDGGHLLYYGVEAVRGKPLDERAQEFGFRIGLALVMMLMVFVTWNDLVHLRVFEAVGSLLN